LKLRNDEQSVMKSGRSGYSKHETQRRTVVAQRYLCRVSRFLMAHWHN